MVVHTLLLSSLSNNLWVRLDFLEIFLYPVFFSFFLTRMPFNGFILHQILYHLFATFPDARFIIKTSKSSSARFFLDNTCCLRLDVVGPPCRKSHLRAHRRREVHGGKNFSVFIEKLISGLGMDICFLHGEFLLGEGFSYFSEGCIRWVLPFFLPPKYLKII